MMMRDQATTASRLWVKLRRRQKDRLSSWHPSFTPESPNLLRYLRTRRRWQPEKRSSARQHPNHSGPKLRRQRSWLPLTTGMATTKTHSELSNWLCKSINQRQNITDKTMTHASYSHDTHRLKHLEHLLNRLWISWAQAFIQICLL